MRILLLGVGMQGKAALHDLVHSKDVTEIVAADYNFTGLRDYVESGRYGAKVRCEHLDASRPENLDLLMEKGPDVAIDLMPVTYHNAVAAAAVKYGVHLVNASYATPEMKDLSDEAKAKGVTILPEFGLDPGIDLVLLGEAVRSMEDVDGIITYGAGVPEPAAADNPLKYKVTWTFDGVLRSYHRAGRIIRDGEIVEIRENEQFNPEHVYEVEIEGLGRLEAFPNGDAIKYADVLGIETSGLRHMGRYTLRWPGHCAFWKPLVDLGFLDDEPVSVDGMVVDRKRYLAALIKPQIQYGPDERDIVIVRVEVTGTQDGQRKKAIYQVIDWRDLETGFTGMSRTVGFTASIGAQWIGTGRITKRGLLSPVTDIPYEPLVQELEKRRIRVTSDV